MSLFKCKMCGGALEISGGETVVTCEYCNTQQTLPKLTDDKRANMYDRANHFRRNTEYDKAMSIYEAILNEDGTDAEAYWSIVLCRYGIEYVEDPITKRRVPTVNRTQYTSVLADADYKSALANADMYQRTIYEEEAKAIDEIQKGILAISQKEDPFDVFICYKETDSTGRRTPDSVLAQELYYGLTDEGFKVFFARITLEDKLGSAYEPYIFAALNSAKVMVVLGTKSEYFNAVWVKNEWSRYLSLIRQGQKKMIIPAYKDMDPYDLPEEFSHLQSQNMSNLGFMQDLIRGIRKIVQVEEPKSHASASSNADTDPLLERAFIFLQDGNFNDCNKYCEKVLDKNPKCAEAYLGKLLADLRVRERKELAFVSSSYENNTNYKCILRFGSAELIREINRYLDIVKKDESERAEEQRQEYERNQRIKSEQAAAAEKRRREQQAEAEKRRQQEQIENDRLNRERWQRELAEITPQYFSIPNQKQIAKAVKKQKHIKRLFIIGIVLLIYWPLAVAVFIYRHKKIKDAIAEENAKYSRIRSEYERLSSLVNQSSSVY